MIVHRVAVAKDEVVAAGVIHRQVRVGVIDAGVDYGHRDVAAAPGDRPSFRGVDIGVWRAAVEAQLAANPGYAVERLASVVEPPLFVEVVVTGRHFRALKSGPRRGYPSDEVWFGVEDVRVAQVPRDGRCFIAGRYANAMDACTRDLDERSGAHHSVRIGPGIRINTWFERDQDVACHERDGRHRLRGGANGQSANNETDGHESFTEAHEAPPSCRTLDRQDKAGVQVRGQPSRAAKTLRNGPGPSSAVRPGEIVAVYALAKSSTRRTNIFVQNNLSTTDGRT